MKKAYLVLKNGKIFEGVRFGADNDAVGELVFHTGVCGYMDTITDPNYYGQILVSTFPMIGNYGVVEEEAEGNPVLFGYVVREHCDSPSNFRSSGTLDDYLKKHGIPGICQVDTREITKIIREYGSMAAAIVSDLDKVPDLNAFSIKKAVEEVSKKEKIQYVKENSRFRVAFCDYGSKHNIVQELLARNCEVIVCPCPKDSHEILDIEVDGIILSDGPGDPAENTEAISVIREWIGKKPIFGIGLGHQLLAIAMGGKTVKLPYGHRGGNQAVKCLEKARTYITAQNHGYVVLSESIEKGTVSFVNVNDGTCEGMEYPAECAFSVQFRPETCEGPQDTSFLLDRFVSNMGGIS